MLVTESGKRKTWLDRSRDILSEAAIGIAADQHSVGAQMRLPDAAVKTQPAIQFRIDNDSVAGMKTGIAVGVSDHANHFMTHDARVLDGNCAGENF